MDMTPAQQTALRNDVIADPVLNALPHTGDSAFAIADAYKVIVTPAYFVWRTLISEHEIVDSTSAQGTVWSWPAYISRSVGEQAGWTRMFNGTFTVNPSLAQVRQGFADIFSGGTGSAQRAHLLAVGQRQANRAEKLFASGAGTQASPSTMTFEGVLSYLQVMQAMGW